MKWLKSVAVLGMFGLTLVPSTGHAATGAALIAGHHGWLAAAVSIDPFSPAGQSGRPSAARPAKPFLRTGTAGIAPAQPGKVADIPNLQTSSALLTKVTSFPMISEDVAVAALGADQRLEPPDTMMAAGPTSLLEMVNSSASIWTKAGTRTAIADLNLIPSMPAGFVFSDPRVLFDAASGRFFWTGLGFNPLSMSSVVFLGVSKTSDPSAGFFVYNVAQTSNGQLHDQPKIGVNSDKVVISWNEFCCGLFGKFKGAETFVFEKATLLSGAVTPVFFVGPNLAQSSPVPAQSLSATTTEYDTFNGTTFTGVMSITGVPPGVVTIKQTNLTTPSTSTPPAAAQPGGSINTNDDRDLSSVWQSGVLWVSGNTGCQPAGSSITRSCVHLVKVSTAGPTPTLLQAFSLGRNGLDAYYPAVTMDSGGDLFVSLTVSSSSVFGSAAVGEVLAGSPPGTISAAMVFQAGTQHYGGSRWGDYSAISVDPSDGSIWADAEYAATGSNRDWGTAAGRFTP